MRSHIRELLAVVFDPIFIKQVVWVVLFGALTVVTILLNIEFLKSTFPDPPRPPDRILNWLPQNTDFVQYGEYFSQVQALIMTIVFLSVASRLKRLPKLFFLLFVMFMLRGFAITLTPLAQITPPNEYLEANVIAQKFYHGMFFSGHSSSALIQAFFFWNDRYKGIRITWFILPVALAQVASMLLAHQHYSIDIFAAFFVVYFVLTFDFTMLIPKALLDVSWMPWSVPQKETVESPSSTVATTIVATTES